MRRALGLSVLVGLMAIGVSSGRPSTNPGTLVSRVEAASILGGQGEGHSMAFNMVNTTYCGGKFSSCDTSMNCNSAEVTGLGGSGNYCQDGDIACSAALCVGDKSYCENSGPNYVCPS